MRFSMHTFSKANTYPFGKHGYYLVNWRLHTIIYRNRYIWYSKLYSKVSITDYNIKDLT